MVQVSFVVFIIIYTIQFSDFYILHITIVGFLLVLNIFLESRLEDAAVDADRILCWLIKLAHEQKAVQQSTQTMKGDTEKYPFLFPNKGNFKSVFLNYLKRKDKHLAIRRIEELLLEMETLSEAGFTDCQPTYEVSLMLLIYSLHLHNIPSFLIYHVVFSSSLFT